ncbi:protocatechuate 3,4-dioxygenase beta chain [Octadecabacter antarcticus 307]|uniref:Protocatechuate 3,4-dioxygenase beta chain n=1 Tax=Octadecabacter antarcticus 307 TaxID=391626 RepID=M9RE14_9RHOB|nr:dioxygenase [Octadecabacter antarcticus]AGI68656.1 protocatechuate 3,4-dioxygenase beta chain [Octadecabacter antarcticus 307]
MDGALKTTPDMITEIVLKSYEKAPDPRTNQILQELIIALHGFAKAVKLTPDELIAATQLLARTGQISDHKRHEFILMSDILGLTMLVETMNDDLPEGAFEPSVLGPFYREGSPEIAHFDNISRGDNDGSPALVSGQVRDIDGNPVVNAMLDIWQTNNNGLYENMDDTQPDYNLRARLRTDGEGTYSFWTVKPESYPIPTDGPVGDVLEAGARHNMRPAHIHFIVSALGYKTIVSELFAREDEYIEGDAVFGVKDSLLVDFTPADEPAVASKSGMENPFWRMSYDFVLVAGDRAQTAFSTER